MHRVPGTRCPLLLLPKMATRVHLPGIDGFRFLAALAARGVTLSPHAGPTCRRGDINLARVALS